MPKYKMVMDEVAMMMNAMLGPRFQGLDYGITIVAPTRERAEEIFAEAAKAAKGIGKYHVEDVEETKSDA